MLPGPVAVAPQGMCSAVNLPCDIRPAVNLMCSCFPLNMYADITPIMVPWGPAHRTLATPARHVPLYRYRTRVTLPVAVDHSAAPSGSR